MSVIGKKTLKLLWPRCQQMSNALHVTPNMCLERPDFLEKFLPQWLHCSSKQGRGGKYQVIWCLMRHQIIHDVGALCVSTTWLFKFFLVDRTLKQKLQGKETVTRGTKGEFYHHALLHHQLSRISSSYLVFPSIFSLPS